jgi:8-oxo-dGTP diphosphatase
MPRSEQANLQIHLATALVRRNDTILLVASRYPNHGQPLWNLPGGRQQPGELLSQTALRELAEETGLQGTLQRLCYVSESYDGLTHFVNFTFAVEAAGEPQTAYVEGDHVIESAWVPIDALAERLSVAVVREPLLGFLRGTLPAYAGYASAGITIEFPD